jgi:hypothetical protein
VAQTEGGTLIPWHKLRPGEEKKEPSCECVRLCVSSVVFVVFLLAWRTCRLRHLDLCICLSAWGSLL